MAKRAKENKYVARATKMSDAELAYAHDDVCAVFELAIADGRSLEPRFWDELGALQQERGKRATARIIAEKQEVPHVSIGHTSTMWEDGPGGPIKLSFAVAVF